MLLEKELVDGVKLAVGFGAGVHGLESVLGVKLLEWPLKPFDVSLWKDGVKDLVGLKLDDDLPGLKLFELVENELSF